MKIEWKFNGESTLILIPEDGRDKAMIQLWRGDGCDGAAIVSSPGNQPETLMLRSVRRSALPAQYEPGSENDGS